MQSKQVLVGDVMAVDPIVVRVDASLEEADVIIRSTYVKLIPVVDGDGALVGVIRDSDLVEYRFARAQGADGMTGPHETKSHAGPGHRSGR